MIDLQRLAKQVTPFAKIVTRPKPPVDQFKLKLEEESKALYSNIPENLKEKLRTDLTVYQLRNVKKMLKAGLEDSLPRFWYKNPPIIVPKMSPVKELTLPLRKQGGRNNYGRITVRHRGGGFKRRIRVLDTKRYRPSTWEVVRLERDPNRSALIALCKEIDGEEPTQYCYILAPEGLQPGMQVRNDVQVQSELKVGCSARLKNISSGTKIYSIEITPGFGGAFCRVAGAEATLISKDEKTALVEFPSKKQMRIDGECFACIGIVGNGKAWGERIIGKAGRNRNLGKRPTVRGVAMNAVDHPHGGGSGGFNKGHHSQSPWGWPS